MLNDNKKILLTIIIIAILGGIQPLIFSKIINYNLPKKKIIFYISIVNVLFISLYTYFIDKEMNYAHIIHTHDDKINICCLFIIYTLLCITVPNLLYTYNMQKDIIVSHNALLYISPVFTLLIAYFLYNKEITLKQFIGTSLIFTGSYFICD